MADVVGSLEEAAIKRKERLRNLRNKTASSENTQKDDNNGEDKVKLPKPIFRSYKPIDENLQDIALPKAKPSDVNERIQSQIEAAKSENMIEEVDLMNLAPRKPDWDLKRDVAKKLEKLEKKTQRAIAELIRERLKSGNQDLAQVVNAGTMRSNQTEEDDDD